MTNRYNNPNSKRKQRAKAKRELESLSVSMAVCPEIKGTFAPSPDEFIALESKPKRIRNEPSTIVCKRREKPFKEPRKLSATGKCKQHIVKN